jgi:hypothetical protein
MGVASQQELQMEMDWFWLHCRQMLTVNEVAAAFEICPEQVRDLVDSGRFLAAGIGDAPNPVREHLRIQRFSVVAWWIYKNELMGNQLPIKRTPLIEHWIKKLYEMDAMIRGQMKAQTEGKK